MCVIVWGKTDRHCYGWILASSQKGRQICFWPFVSAHNITALSQLKYNINRFQRNDFREMLLFNYLIVPSLSAEIRDNLTNKWGCIQSVCIKNSKMSVPYTVNAIKFYIFISLINWVCNQKSAVKMCDIFQHHGQNGILKCFHNFLYFRVK